MTCFQGSDPSVLLFAIAQRHRAQVACPLYMMGSLMLSRLLYSSACDEGFRSPGEGGLVASLGSECCCPMMACSASCKGLSNELQYASLPTNVFHSTSAQLRLARASKASSTDFPAPRRKRSTHLQRSFRTSLRVYSTAVPTCSSSHSRS